MARPVGARSAGPVPSSSIVGGTPEADVRGSPPQVVGLVGEAGQAAMVVLAALAVVVAVLAGLARLGAVVVADAAAQAAADAAALAGAAEGRAAADGVARANGAQLTGWREVDGLVQVVVRRVGRSARATAVWDEAVSGDGGDAGGRHPGPTVAPP